jgi:hypothetical protein
MTREIKDVVVQWISLVTDEYTPAVPKAEARFALFKAKPKWLMKLEIFFWGVPNDITDMKVNKLIKTLQTNKKNLSSQL